MLTVDHYELIRRKVEIDGETQRDVAKELSHSRKTVAKALKLRIPPGYRLSKPRPRPVLDPFKHIIDAWIEQNKTARRKQRHKANLESFLDGNEKGDVENGCKRSENTYLSSAPHVDGIGQLAVKLFDDCRNDLQRKGPDVHGGKSVGELLEEERPYLLALQSERFAACVRRSTFVDSHALVHVDTVRYSVPVEWAYHACVIEAFVDDERLAGALLDRLTHHVHILEIMADSFRLKSSMDEGQKKQE
jgi:hypothetical protein